MTPWDAYPFDIIDCELTDAQGPVSFETLWDGKAHRWSYDPRIVPDVGVQNWGPADGWEETA